MIRQTATKSRLGVRSWVRYLVGPHISWIQFAERDMMSGSHVQTHCEQGDMRRAGVLCGEEADTQMTLVNSALGHGECSGLQQELTAARHRRSNFEAYAHGSYDTSSLGVFLCSSCSKKTFSELVPSPSLDHRLSAMKARHTRSWRPVYMLFGACLSCYLLFFVWYELGRSVQGTSYSPPREVSSIGNTLGPPQERFSTLHLTTEQCETTFPGLTQDLNDSISLGIFKIQPSGDNGPLQVQIKDGKVQPCLHPITLARAWY